ncbi:hypothetical protein JXA40_09000 [bacterium]|nr:hypothetical protein [candidate division CSSED10-310 bacterium]
MDPSLIPSEQDEIAQKLRETIARAFSNSCEVQKILRIIEKKGFKPTVWMLVGVFLLPLDSERTDSELPDEIQFTRKDLAWLKKLRINIDGGPETENGTDC